MPADDPTAPATPLPTVFLSYASGDRAVAQLIRDTLPGFGLEVWYDASDLTGGDAWDQKIRRQIRECDYFMPVISAQTQARVEGYFRREWRLAVERTLDMADDHTFLLPVVIDDTAQAGARVPEKFLSVQWSRLPGGRPTAAFEAMCRRLAAGSHASGSTPQDGVRPARAAGVPGAQELPVFPKEEPGQRVKFWMMVAVWGAKSAWMGFKRLPRWVRILVYIWLAIGLLSKGCESSHDRGVTPAEAQKLKQIAESYQGSLNKGDGKKLVSEIAEAFSEVANDTTGAQNALLAVPLAVSTGDAAARKLADGTFAQIYGRIAIANRGHVGLALEPLASADPAAAAALGRAQKASYVLYGGIETATGVPSLTIKIVSVEDESVVWTKGYPVAGANPVKIAEEVGSKVPSLDAD